MEICEHGGACCGVKHIKGFGRTPDARHGRILNDRGEVLLEAPTFQEVFVALVGRHDQHPSYPGEGGRRILEAQLTDNQVESWHQIMVDNGFKKTIRFYNRNSGNHVNTYLRHTQGFEIFDVSTQIPAQIAPAVAVQRAPVSDMAAAFDNDSNMIVWPMYTNRSTAAAGTTAQLRDPSGLSPVNRGKVNEVAIIIGSDGEYFTVEFADGHRSRLYKRRFRRVKVILPVAPVAPAPVPEAPQGPVFTQFFASLANGGNRGPFATSAAALEAWPRCRNFVWQRVYARGTFEDAPMTREQMEGLLV